MRKIFKAISLGLSSLFVVTFFAACGGETIIDPPKTNVPNLNSDFTYEKQNTEGLMQFYSSDAEMDKFINEYMERHLRYSDKAIGDIKVGEGNSVWKEWEAMSVMWMDTTGIGYSPKQAIGDWFSSITQDAFGYIWFDDGLDPAVKWGQSWEFPNQHHSTNLQLLKQERDEDDPYLAEYYNTSYFNGRNQLGGNYFGNNSLSALWTGVSDTGRTGTIGRPETTLSDDYMTITGNNIRKLTYTYETPEASKAATTVEEKRNLAKPYMGIPYYSPFLELDFSITDFDALGSADQVEDVIVWWKGGSGDKGSQWSTDRMVKYSEFSSNYSDKFSTTQHVVFPMYAHDNWGKSESMDDAITDMKIELIFKNGINGEIRLEEVTLAFDGRQLNNNNVFLEAAAYYFQYTQDTAWLEQNLNRFRRALQFLLTYCHGDDYELITAGEFVGHDGSSNYDYFNYEEDAVNPGVGHGIGDGYWDAVNYPQISLYGNINYYKALNAMLYLESMAEAAGVVVDDNAVVMDAMMEQEVSYSKTTKSLQELIDAFVPEFQDYFWNDATGRFHLGYLPETDPGVVAGVLGTVVDYGFTTYNQEAIELGLATEAQAKSVMDWINGVRTVQSDRANNSSNLRQIYYFKFAPRWTTQENVYQFWYQFDGSSSSQYGWNKQVQNGGTALHCAYYDVVAENIVNGSDAAFSKIKNIQDWYNTIKDFGATGKSFYRNYYTREGIQIQGGPTSGVLGLDYEFIEAAIVPTIIPTVFFGLGSDTLNVLNITPNLPSALDFWRMENLMFAGITYDLAIGSNWVQINNVSSSEGNVKVKVSLTAPSGTFTVRQHNRILTEGVDYTVSGGKVIITAPMQNGRIQIVV